MTALAPPRHAGLPPRTLARFAQGWARHRLTGRPVPLNAMVAVTDTCDARCGYCAIPLRRTPDPDTATLVARIDALARAGCARVGLWGGEPLMRDDIGEIVAACRARGLWTSLDSNGWRYPERADALDGLDHLVLSLDGRPRHHDAQRGRGAHAKVLRAMAEAKARGQPFWTLTVLTRHNLRDVGYLIDLAEAHGARAAFQILHHPPALAGGRDEGLWPEDYHPVLERLLRAKRAGAPVANSRRGLEALLAWKDHTRSTAPEGRCLAGRLFVNVDVDGRAYPCSLRIDGRGPPLGDDAAATMAGLSHPDCNACTATAFTEYNLLFGLDIGTVAEWMEAL